MFSPLPPFLLPLSLPLAQAEHWLGSSESLPRPDAATEGQADGGGGRRIRCHHCHAGHVTVARQCRRLRLGQAATDAAAAGTVTVHSGTGTCSGRRRSVPAASAAWHFLLSGKGAMAGPGFFSANLTRNARRRRVRPSWATVTRPMAGRPATECSSPWTPPARASGGYGVRSGWARHCGSPRE